MPGTDRAYAVLPAYARAPRCPVLTSRMLLRRPVREAGRCRGSLSPSVRGCAAPICGCNTFIYGCDASVNGCDASVNGCDTPFVVVMPLFMAANLPFMEAIPLLMASTLPFLAATCMLALPPFRQRPLPFMAACCYKRKQR
eukprot:174649-Rhodomonas_salina.2